MVFNCNSTLQILPEVILIWSFEVSQKGGADDWLEVTMHSSVCCLCLVYLDILNVVFSSQNKITRLV